MGRKLSGDVELKSFFVLFLAPTASPFLPLFSWASWAKAPVRVAAEAEASVKLVAPSEKDKRLRKSAILGRPHPHLLLGATRSLPCLSVLKLIFFFVNLNFSFPSKYAVILRGVYIIWSGTIGGERIKYLFSLTKK